MRTIFAAFAWAAAVAWAAPKPSALLSPSMADSAMSRQQGALPNVRYEVGVFQRSLLMLYAKTKNAKYRDYVLKQVDSMIADDGTITGYNFTLYSLDPLRTGEAILFAYEQTKADKYKIALDKFRAQLGSQPRTSEGAFWHRSTYPNQQWLDGVYMADIFYADYTAKFASQDNAAWDDILKQFQLVEKHLRVAENAFPGGAASGLLYHGYDASLTAVWSIPPEGHCPEVWSRAVGWYAMALVDVLDVFPKSHRGHKELRDYLRRLATQIAEAVDPTTGAWWLVMGYPNRPGNYIESSSSAMFIYTLLRGVRLDYLPNRRYIQIASKAYEYLANTFVVPETNGTLSWNGTVSVGSLGSNGTFQYYVSVPLALNDLKGLAPFIMASLEYEML